ncbi:universal stress protein uspa [hydrocarbon metagenome]|uniref:Universal stress protein uspa n=1 Tax=hydrocarbon metagenome TaxID=938273 RepID=A0A0W8E498_9ZZZZ
MYKKILVPLDDSEYALGAVKLAAQFIIKGMGESLTLVHIVDIARKEGINIINTRLLDDYRDEKSIYAKNAGVFNRSKQILQQQKVKAEFILETGRPGEKILQITEEGNYDLIVMGSRGLTPAKEIVLGSVSNRVLHQAKCPVIVYKP